MADAARTNRRPRRSRSPESPAAVKLPTSREPAAAAQSSRPHHESRLAKVGVLRTWLGARRSWRRVHPVSAQSSSSISPLSPLEGLLVLSPSAWSVLVAPSSNDPHSPRPDRRFESEPSRTSSDEQRSRSHDATRTIDRSTVKVFARGFNRSHERRSQPMKRLVTCFACFVLMIGSAGRDL
jgi:hypothetical protein